VGAVNARQRTVAPRGGGDSNVSLALEPEGVTQLESGKLTEDERLELRSARFRNSQLPAQRNSGCAPSFSDFGNTLHWRIQERPCAIDCTKAEIKRALCVG
jgi:hypothetical protein